MKNIPVKGCEHCPNSSRATSRGHGLRGEATIAHREEAVPCVKFIALRRPSHGPATATRCGFGEGIWAANLEPEQRGAMRFTIYAEAYRQFTEKFKDIHSRMMIRSLYLLG